MPDYVVSKPISVKGYDLHRITAGLTDGAKALYVDRGDQVVIRTDNPIHAQGTPVRNFEKGEILAFELRACVGTKVNGKHRYYPTKDWASRHRWLERQGFRYGFEIIAVHCTAEIFPIAKKGKTFTIDKTDFMGVLKITDAHKFSEALTNGVGGKAKAFGFGMLNI